MLEGNRYMARSVIGILALLGLAGCVDIVEQPKPRAATVVAPPAQSSGNVYVPPGGSATVVTRP